MLRFIKIFAPAVFLFSTAIADYSITPVRLVITPESKITSLEFRNDNNENKKFQVSILEVTKQGSKDVFKESKELDAVPAMFSLAPGKTQIIRVQSKNIETLKDRNFKLSIKELGLKKSVKGQNVVHVIPEFRVPITSQEVKSEDTGN